MEVAPSLFPPRLVALVKAMACVLPAKPGLPVSRFSRAELRRHVLAAGLVAEISGMTIWRWLRADAIRPWTHRSWIFPRDPDFAGKAGPILDLYHRCWKGKPLGPRERLRALGGREDADSHSQPAASDHAARVGARDAG